MRTNKLENKSSPIRKGSIPEEEINKLAKELTCKQTVEVVQAPPIEPVVKWDYKIISEYIKAHCNVHDTFTITSDDLLKLIPQNKHAYDIARQFKRTYWLSYRKTEGENNNDTYVFYVEPSVEELMIELSEKKAVIERWKNISDEQEEEINKLTNSIEFWRDGCFIAQEESNRRHNKILQIRDNTFIYWTVWVLLWWLLCYLYLHLKWL